MGIVHIEVVEGHKFRCEQLSSEPDKFALQCDTCARFIRVIGRVLAEDRAFWWTLHEAPTCPSCGLGEQAHVPHSCHAALVREVQELRGQVTVACSSCGGRPDATIREQRAQIEKLSRQSNELLQRAINAEDRANMLAASNKSLEKRVDWADRVGAELIEARNRLREVQDREAALEASLAAFREGR